MTSSHHQPVQREPLWLPSPQTVVALKIVSWASEGMVRLDAYKTDIVTAIVVSPASPRSKTDRSNSSLSSLTMHKRSKHASGTSEQARAKGAGHYVTGQVTRQTKAFVE